jgi:hypothetical protein
LGYQRQGLLRRGSWRERWGARAAANDLPNRVSCRPGGATYKGKHLDQLADTNLGTVGARVGNRTLDTSKITRRWWPKEDFVVAQE